MFVDYLTNEKEKNNNFPFATIMNLCFAEICQPLSKVLKMLDPPYDVYMSTSDKKD